MNQEFLREAIRLSTESVQSEGAGPFGAVIAKGDTIVGRGVNRVTSSNDPTAHAEIVAIRDACRHLGTFSLAGCAIYSSCEPCPMCLAAVYWARIDEIYYAATRDDAAAAGFDDAFIYDEIGLPPVERSVPARQANRSEALEAFEAWAACDDRIEY
jgi:tRNA(Arg) A34 adenosine deaminase TadA